MAPGFPVGEGGKALLLRNVLRNSSYGTIGEVDTVSPTDNDDDDVVNNNNNSSNDGSDADCMEDSLASLLNDTSLNSNSSDPGGGLDPAGASVLFDIPPKEIVIVVAMLALWIYSIIITRRAWYRILKQ